MTEAAQAVNKDIIDGSRVIHREQAKIFTPLSKYEDGLSPTYGVDKCVLDDGRVVFQCVHPDPPENCEYWHLSGVGVRSHLVVHARVRKQAEQEEIKAKLVELQQREAQRRENYRNGARRTAEIRKAKREGEKEQEMTASKGIAKKIDNLQTSLEGASEGLARMGVVLDNIRKTMDNAVGALEDLADATSVQTPDPVLKEKADSWDALQALMNKAPR